MNKQEARNELEGKRGFFQHWIGYSQRLALLQALRGEEGDYFADLLTKLKERIEAMPKTYETEAIERKDKVIHLHYFRGSVDAWIVEKDMGDESGDLLQLQAFGFVDVGGGSLQEADMGYISIQELIELGVEMDLYWEPKTVGELVQ